MVAVCRVVEPQGGAGVGAGAGAGVGAGSRQPEQPEETSSLQRMLLQKRRQTQQLCGLITTQLRRTARDLCELRAARQTAEVRHPPPWSPEIDGHEALLVDDLAWRRYVRKYLLAFPPVQLPPESDVDLSLLVRRFGPPQEVLLPPPGRTCAEGFFPPARLARSWSAANATLDARVVPGSHVPNTVIVRLLWSTRTLADVERQRPVENERSLARRRRERWWSGGDAGRDDVARLERVTARRRTRHKIAFLDHENVENWLGLDQGAHSDDSEDEAIGEARRQGESDRARRELQDERALEEKERMAGSRLTGALAEAVEASYREGGSGRRRSPSPKGSGRERSGCKKSGRRSGRSRGGRGSGGSPGSEYSPSGSVGRRSDREYQTGRSGGVYSPAGRGRSAWSKDTADGRQAGASMGGGATRTGGDFLDERAGPLGPLEAYQRTTGGTQDAGAALKEGEISYGGGASPVPSPCAAEQSPFLPSRGKGAHKKGKQRSRKAGRRAQRSKSPSPRHRGSAKHQKLGRTAATKHGYTEPTAMTAPELRREDTTDKSKYKLPPTCDIKDYGRDGDLRESMTKDQLPVDDDAQGVRRFSRGRVAKGRDAPVDDGTGLMIRPHEFGSQSDDGQSAASATPDAAAPDAVAPDAAAPDEQSPGVDGEPKPPQSGHSSADSGSKSSRPASKPESAKPLSATAKRYVREFLQKPLARIVLPEPDPTDRQITPWEILKLLLQLLPRQPHDLQQSILDEIKVYVRMFPQRNTASVVPVVLPMLHSIDDDVPTLAAVLSTLETVGQQMDSVVFESLVLLPVVNDAVREVVLEFLERVGLVDPYRLVLAQALSWTPRRHRPQSSCSDDFWKKLRRDAGNFVTTWSEMFETHTRMIAEEINKRKMEAIVRENIIKILHSYDPSVVQETSSGISINFGNPASVSQLSNFGTIEVLNYYVEMTEGAEESPLHSRLSTAIPTEKKNMTHLLNWRRRNHNLLVPMVASRCLQGNRPLASGVQQPTGLVTHGPSCLGLERLPWPTVTIGVQLRIADKYYRGPPPTRDWLRQVR